MISISATNFKVSYIQILDHCLLSIRHRRKKKIIKEIQRTYVEIVIKYFILQGDQILKFGIKTEKSNLISSDINDLPLSSYCATVA